jgi:hypothetical protein
MSEKEGEAPRAEALQELSRMSVKYPKLRVMQLLGNVLDDGDHYYVEDSDLLSALRAFPSKVAEAARGHDG